MGRILDEIFCKCDFERSYVKLFEEENISRSTFEFENKLQAFEENISDEKMLKAFKKLRGELIDLQGRRDGYLIKTLTTHGLAVGIQIYTEIMQEGM